MTKKLDQIITGIYLSEEFNIEESGQVEEIVMSMNKSEKHELVNENLSELVLVSRTKKMKKSGKFWRGYSLGMFFVFAIFFLYYVNSNFDFLADI